MATLPRHGNFPPLTYDYLNDRQHYWLSADQEGFMRASMRSLVVGMLVSSLVVALTASFATAHVEIAPESAARGSLSVLNFVVPNESETASTVSFEIEFPTTPPIASVAVQPMPGWTAKVEKSSPGANSTPTISRVTWSGGAFGPGEFQQFVVRAQLPSRGKQVTFKALQTYSDGEVVRWIQQSVKGTPEPEHPAPTLQLTVASRDHD